jgi:hypothetical protein
MSADKETLLQSADLLPVPLIRMVYEANPAAISHQSSVIGVAFTILWKHHHRFRYVYSLYPEAAKAERPQRYNSALCSAERQSRKYSPGSQLPSREHLLKNADFASAPTFICEKVLH